MKIHCLYDALVSPNELKPHPKNPNRHSIEQLDRLAKILDYQGFRYAIKVSKQSGFITSGHGRLEAAKRLGAKQVPVVYQDYTDADQEYADIVADNAISEWSSLDFSLINLEISNLGPDLDIDLLGIKNFDLDPNGLIEKINSGDENSEWVGMPEFEEGDPYIRLIYQFKTELEREIFVKENNIVIDKKLKNQWLVLK